MSSDHRGYGAKERIKVTLIDSGHEVVDYGCDGQGSCDYPDYGLPAAEAVPEGKTDRAILICGSGLGMSIVANKVKGVRAALCHDELTAQLSRKHNNANVLCLPADLVGEHLLRSIVDLWLKTDFEGGRHARRNDKISTYESNGEVAGQ